LLAAVRLLDHGGTARPRDWVLWGVAAGIVALVRAEAVALVIVPAASLASLGARRQAFRVLVATLLGALIALTPWTIRNARRFGAFVPTSTGLGRTMWIGHNPIADGSMSVPIQLAMQRALDAHATYALEPSGELALNRALTRDAVAFALAHPQREIALIP